MPVHVTYHEPRRDKLSVGLEPLLGKKIGDRVSKNVGTVDNFTAVSQSCLARIYATEACVIEIGNNAIADVTKGEIWPAGVEIRWIPKGDRISVIAAA